MTQLHPAVSDFLKSQPLSMYIGGEFVPARSGKTFETRDPGNGTVLAAVAAGGAEDVDRAVKAARTAFAQNPGHWAQMPANDRGVILHRFADLIDKHRDILAQIESLDVGKPIAQALAFDIPNVAQTLRYYADLAVHTRRREPIAVSGFEAYSYRSPWGVCAFIIPWNFPALLVGWGIGPALAAGNTVVLKPAEDTPLSALYLARLAEQAGIPKGVFNVVTGLGETAGAALAGHAGINHLQFTGSPEVGRLVAESCARNLVPVKLELGGKGAAVIFDDVDLGATATALAGAITLNTGQVCCTATRWVVHEKIFDRFVEKATATLRNVAINHGLEPNAGMGPAVSEKQRQRILGYLDRGRQQGATALLEGGKATVKGHENGYFVKPALLAGSADNVCAREEIFGPVAFLMSFKDERQAIEVVNQSQYGLANSVWSNNLERARRVAESLVAGNSWINAHNLFAHGIPYGGVNLSGFGGGVLGPDALMNYLRPQSVVRVAD